MQDSYNKNIQLRCLTCGQLSFEFNEEKTWVKCINCGREYNGGYDELLELNQENINQELEESKEEILKDLKSDVQDMLGKALKGSKHLKFKK